MAIKHFGTKYRDVLFGTDGKDDYFYGYEGDDKFYSSTGKDTYDGGKGSDTVSYDYAATGVVLNLDSGVGIAGEAQGDKYTSIENVNGSRYSDTIWGSDDGNRIHSRGGNDWVYAGNGDDYVTGSYGNDWLFGGADDDRVYGGNDDDRIYGGSGDDILEGGRGADRIYGGSDIDTIRYYGSNAGVTVDLAARTASGGDATGDYFYSIENVTGSYWYADELTGTDGNNVLDGLRGDDVFHGTRGSDTIIGGFGADTLDYSGLTYGIDVDLAEGTVEKTFDGTDTVSGVETVIGTNSFDRFHGSTGSDTFRGLDGNDTFYGSAGADEFYGGAGRDSVDYASSGAAVTVVLEEGSGYNGDADGDSYSSIANVYGSAYGDTLEGDGGTNSLHGRSGDDTLVGEGGNDYLSGGTGSDTLIGGAGDDTLVGDGLGNFVADTLIGGEGFDTIVYDTAFQTDGLTVDLAAGTASDGDTLYGIEGVNILANNWNVFGDNVDNRFEVVGVGNSFDGRGGDDVFVAKSYVSTGPQTGNSFDGGAGTDTVDYSISGSFYVSGQGIEIDLDDGTAQELDYPQALEDEFTSIENVVGSNRADRIFGDDGANDIDGAMGDDLINGRDGDDVLTGGWGNDTFVFDHRDSGEDDTITDFTIGDDRIDLDNTEISDWADLQDAGDGDYFEQVGANVVIHSSDEDTITLLNTRIEDLGQNDFIFA